MNKWTEEEQLRAIDSCRKALTSESLQATSMEVVGSTYINGEGADIDVLCFVKDADVDCLGFDGWLYGGSVGEGNESCWGSWKKGNVNMLVTCRRDYYAAWLTSAEVCRLLYLRNITVTKQDRVAIHNIVMDDSTAEAEVERLKKGR